MRKIKLNKQAIVKVLKFLFKGESGKLLDATKKQISSDYNYWRNDPDKRNFHFGNKFYESARKHNITERDALDVYYNGSVFEDGKMVRKYNGYEIGIFYKVFSDTGRTMITYTWKRNRR